MSAVAEHHGSNDGNQGSRWLIVGASRGIGRGFVDQLLARGNSVVATVRKPTPALAELDNCQIFTCDVTSEASIDGFVAELSRRDDLPGTIDRVVVNAGILKYPNRATELSFDDFALHLHTNTIGPIICAQRLLRSGALAANATIAFISSDSGSAQRFLAQEDGFAAYAASKAALNQALRHMAAELRRQRSSTVILAVHPGEVATDMADIELDWPVEGQMSVEESVSACIRTIESKGPENSGTFWTWENQPYPW